MRALNDVIESGKVRYIGASSMAAWEFQMLQNIAETNGWCVNFVHLDSIVKADKKGRHKFISMQNFHNLIYREYAFSFLFPA